MSIVGHYPTDVSDTQWDTLQLLLPKRKWRPGGPGRSPRPEHRRSIGAKSWGVYPEAL